MEKYIIVLIILAMMFFIFCTFPILAKEPTKSYIITRSSYIADKILTDYDKWQTNTYYVYKLKNSTAENIIPKSKLINEYTEEKNNNILSDTPYLRKAETNSQIIYGVPYIID